MNKKLVGTGVALVTPFDEYNQIDFNGLQTLLEYTYADGKGVNYWVVMGTTGEAATLNHMEQLQVLDFVVENNPNELPIVLGIGGNNTEAIKKSIDETDFEQVEAILSVSPYYNKPSQEGIFQHYTAIADHSPRPIILYNVPARTGSNISSETTLRLAEHENIIGIKEASSNLYQCMQIAKNKPKDFLLLSGDDMMLVPMMAMGAQGGISVLANAFPVIFAEMINYAINKDIENASKSLYQILDLHPLMYEESNPVGIKQVLKEKGIIENFVRLPLISASEILQERIKSLLS